MISLRTNKKKCNKDRREKMFLFFYLLALKHLDTATL